MKVLFKLDLKVETVSNISVNDKCFPVIGGVPPYSNSTSNKKLNNPLIRESALWFKTLTLDAIYVDCDRCLIFWSSIQNDVGQDVILRKRNSKSFHSDFIPEHAKPLFEDFTLFDFDASLKEMMGKCSEVAEKLHKKSHSSASINSKLANLLHVYILPSIHFANDDLYALSRTRCLIEERVMRVDSEILIKAQGKHLLEVSLENLKENLIHSYDFESESYLRSCDPTFLKLFSKKVEEDSITLNLNLEAQQSKVNWAKDHQEDYNPQAIKELQQKRNNVHSDVEKLLRVREALRNVLTRKEKFKRKKHKKTRPEHIESCFHSIFVEINRRWEIDVKIMDQLITDKVNISGAREATLSTILELESSNRNSERSTRFEPVDFDCHIDGGEISGKSSSWLTLQERVSNILQDVNSASYKMFMDGCTLIISQIDLALSEYHLTKANKKNVNPVSSDDDFVVIRRINRSPVSQEIHERRSGLVMKDEEFNLSKQVLQKNLLEVHNKSVKTATLSHINYKHDTSNFSSDTMCQGKEKSVSLENFNGNVEKRVHSLILDPNSSKTGGDMSRSVENSYQSIPDCVASETTSFIASLSGETTMNIKHLAMRDLTQSIENLKGTIQDHFRDVINCLQNELEPDAGDDCVIIDTYIDKNELIWKAYERYFSEKILPPLITLYEISLINSISSTYQYISQMSKHELLEGDKILTLFNETSTLDSFSVQGPRRDNDTYSMARTVSDFSLDILDCSITDLYALTNSDSDDIFKRFNLNDETENSAVAVVLSSSSSESGASVKTADLFDDDEESSSNETALPGNDLSTKVNSDAKTVLNSNDSKSEGFLTSQESTQGKSVDIESTSSCSDPVSERPLLRIYSKGVSDILDHVLSPFQRQMEKCIKAKGILDKLRYLSKAIEGLNNDISKLYGADHQSACDDIITMLILALSQMPREVFVGLYINLNMLINVLPKFLNGSLCEYNVVSLVASYDYLKNRNTSQQIIRRVSSDFGSK